MATKVLITDIAWADTRVESAVLARVGAELVLAGTGQEAELVELVRDVDAILTCFAQVTEHVIAAGEQLRVVGRYGIGVDNIAVEAATARGIPVTNVPVYCDDEVAEHVLAFVLCLVRGLHRYNQTVRDGDWSLERGLPIRRLRGRTLGLVGYGHIGQAVAQRARALGLEVIASDPQAQERIVADGLRSASLQELAADSDFVSLHVPLNESTRGLIDAAFLEAMKPSAYLVNAARGALVDQEALYTALRDGKIEGAGLDVFEPERLDPSHPLLTLDNVVVTPHTAFYSEESMADLARIAAENVASVLAGEQPASIVNVAALAQSAR
jgi:D-3-phosphoglycerate dehydrogenase